VGELSPNQVYPIRLVVLPLTRGGNNGGSGAVSYTESKKRPRFQTDVTAGDYDDRGSITPKKNLDHEKKQDRYCVPIPVTRRSPDASGRGGKSLRGAVAGAQLGNAKIVLGPEAKRATVQLGRSARKKRARKSNKGHRGGMRYTPWIRDEVRVRACHSRIRKGPAAGATETFKRSKTDVKD